MTDLLENKINSAVSSVEPSAEFTEKLWSQIKTSNHQISVSKSISRWFLIPVSAVLVLTLVLIVVSPQQVMAAFRSLFSFIPGIGFVQDDENTLYLSEPVSIEQDGVILTIEQVVVDADKTTISYRFDGLPAKGTGEASACFYDNNQLQLSDGTTYHPIGGGVSNNTARIEFMSLPEGVTSADLLVSMNFVDPLCSAPQEWDANFSLGTTPPGEDLYPVIGIEGNQISGDIEPLESSDSSIHMVADRAVTLNDGYLLAGLIEWENENWESVFVNMEKTYALDAEGNTVLIELSDEGDKENKFSFKILGKDYISPITFHIGSLIVFVNNDTDLPTFSFDPGSEPQIGQSWDLNQEVDVFGRQIIVKSVSVVQQTIEGEEESVEGYSVEVSSESDINGFIVCKGEEENTGIWGQTMSGKDGNMNFETFYSERLPYGMVNCSIRNIQFEQEGSWQFEWQLPSENE